ncbi:PRC-barrel domain-containing protein [Patescibacteria group bacterium]|nr:PRC-barrel domain-containing protein [Patescibacteria group bacterium]
MYINYKNLIGLPVQTKSGLLLGKIKSFEIESDSQNILKYFIKSRNLISKLLSEEVEEIIISRNQVISLDEEKMIVDDASIKELGGAGVFGRTEKGAPALGSRLSISKIDGECSK